MAIEGFTYPSELMPVNPFRSVPLEFARAGAGVGSYAILSAKDYESWRARAAEYVRWTAQAIANMREGLRRGYVSAAGCRGDGCCRCSRRSATDTPANVFYQSARRDPADVPAEERRRFSEGITAGVKGGDPARRTDACTISCAMSICPARGRASRLSALPLGPAWYAHLVRRETASRLAPADIHAIGSAETERLRGPIAECARRGGIRGQCASLLRGCAARAAALLYKAPEELLDFYAQLKVSAAAAVATEFAESPQADFLIRPGRAVSRRRGARVVTMSAPRTAARPRCCTSIPLTQPLVPAYRGLPARGVAGPSLSARHSAGAIRPAEIPPLRRRSGIRGGLGALCGVARRGARPVPRHRGEIREPWDQLACAAGLVVDTGVHGLGWSREQALEYLRGAGADERGSGERDRGSHHCVAGRGFGLRHGGTGFQGSAGPRAAGARRPFRPARLSLPELIDDGAMPLDILESAANLWLNARH